MAVEDVETEPLSVTTLAIGQVDDEADAPLTVLVVLGGIALLLLPLILE